MGEIRSEPGSKRGVRSGRSRFPDVDDARIRDPCPAQVVDRKRRVSPLEVAGGAPPEEARLDLMRSQDQVDAGSIRNGTKAASPEIGDREESLEAVVLQPFDGIHGAYWSSTFRKTRNAMA